MIFLAHGPKVYTIVSIAGLGLASSDYTQREMEIHICSLKPIPVSVTKCQLICLKALDDRKYLLC